MIEVSAKLIARFWPKVLRADGCWPWIASRDKYGYGLFLVGGKRGRYHRAHRIAYLLSFGGSIDGLSVCHRCDNPSCVRPDHLFLGTHAENMADMKRKGRGRGGTPPGERHHRAKLSTDQVAQVRALVASGASKLSVGKRFGVSGAQICNIISGKHRAHG